MPGTSTSLDSLSSPSPSPSPPPDNLSKAEPSSAGLDGDSELSELTEDEQDDQTNGHGANGSSRRGRTHSGGRGMRPSRRGGRRKRNSIVPAPMWGWAATKSSSAVEEEEEEERSKPHNIMEEEEEGEEDAADADQPKQSGLPIVADDELDHSVPAPPPPVDQSLGSVTPAPPIPSSHEMAALDLVGLALAVAEKEKNTDMSRKESIDNDDDGKDELADDTDGEVSDDDPAQPDVDRDNDNDTDSEEEQLKEEEEEEEDDDDPKAVLEDELEEDVDMTAPPVESIAPVVAAASASSIMAGSGVVDPGSPSPSASEGSPSPASSRSPSPASPLKSPVNTSLLAQPATAAPPDNADEKEEEEEEEEEEAEEPPPKPDIPPTTKGKGKGKQKPELNIDAEDQDQDVDIDADVSLDDDMEVEMESDLQPAHRAEALEVLAGIEFKFGRLREILYVERMQQLAWEETLILEGTHPELIHYQKELANRRDKRVELASRKRELEITTIMKRRRVHEDGTWSWWKHERDQLQTDMIADNNRKKRKLERERRAVERPQSVRRIPSMPQDAPQPPTLRQIIDSFPFGSKKQKSVPSTSHTHTVYPELSTLPPAEVARDLDFIYSLRRQFEQPRIPPSGMGSHINGPTGPLPMPYDAYPESYPPGFSGRDGRMPPPSQSSYHHPPLPPPMMAQAGPSSIPAFPGFNGNSSGPNSNRGHHQHISSRPGSRGASIHNPSGSTIHGPSPFAPMDQDLPGPGASGSHHPPHPFFGSSSQPPSGYHAPSRRSSMSPAPNGASNKGPGQWMGPGMGMGAFGLGGPSKAPDWMDRRADLEEEDRREREHREREREHMEAADRREREQRERDRDRDKEMERREREREGYHMQPPHVMHRHSSHPHVNPVPHSHHHHRTHHHHVVHHHHGAVPPGPSLSPRSSRDFERPHSHPGAEMMGFSAAKPPPSLAPPHHWKGEEPPDFRSKHNGRPPAPDDRERPVAVPFVMGSSTPNRSPRNSWNAPDDYRAAPNYVSSPGHRYSSASSTSSRAGLPNPMTVSPQTRTLPPPTSPNRYRDRDDPLKHRALSPPVSKMGIPILPPLEGRNSALVPGEGKNGALRMVNGEGPGLKDGAVGIGLHAGMREMERRISPPPRLGLAPPTKLMVDGL
ncbi:Sds3-like-domain-containing protein [Desarmillaria tabescens]|uniref:Sds3-like-domain-containing protein n=1 Tax=Armillaria tabescens TaxID=1929756 RepID=A0AA39TXK9_ARMTA|nr:Sds3-like-domain-containing protein [Desarmillaria tabescens]KAK0469333.1 Sds3-like-domain-containing protein [Desarmillaria tabescens]